MKIHEIGLAVVVLVEDDSAVGRASHQELCVLEGVLTAIRDSVTEELQRRDQQRQRTAHVAP